MKDRLTRNLGMKILSLLIAIFVWLIIVNTQDPVTTQKFSNITVTPVNAEELEQEDKVYTILEGETVDVTVTGRRSYVESLKSSDFKAEADLSKLSVVNAAEIEVTCTKYTTDDVKLVWSEPVMKISLEDKISSTYSLDVSLKNEVEDGYYISDKIASPNMITISGAESLISKIHKVVVEVNVQGRVSSFQMVATPIIYDNNGDVIDTSKLELSENEITININMVKTKEVALNITTTGTPKYGYEVAAGFEYEPKKITIAGSEDVLKEIDTIDYAIDVTGQSSDFEENLAINTILEQYKDQGVVAVDETQNIAVSVEFHKLENKEIEVSTGNIQLRNVPSGMSVEMNTDYISVLVQAGGDEIKQLDASDIEPYIDLQNYSVGTHLLSVQFEEEDSFTVINQPTVNLTLQSSQSATGSN